ncbi:glycoside hydrolase [Ceratobasidium sp. AG-I]|nr:glycoside hydrolase [Ceratobasidium sp. AG-I]
MIARVCTLLLAGALATGASPLLRTKRDDQKYVFAHVIVGNTYIYTIEQWTSDIELASSKAIDVFSLNVGSDSWQPERIKQAYDAAQEAASDFKPSISLDMNELACASAADGQRLIDNFITPVKNHPSAFIYNSKTFLSTFAGEWCTFGQGDPTAGWQWFLSSTGIPIYFIPNFHVGDPTALTTTWNFIDGYKLWNAWPQTAKDDTQWLYMQHAPGKGYMTLVSPWFFIRRSSGDNRYLRGDNFMYRSRWEQLIENRDSLSLVEIATWNDFGESTYIGPLAGSIPAGIDYVSSWTNYTAYYANWFKFGEAPTIVTDQVYMWARPQPKNAGICLSGSQGAVRNADWADNLLYISVFLTDPAQISCFSGTNSNGTNTASGGVHELTVSLSSGSVGCSVTRNGVVVIDYRPTEFTYSTNPSICSMNAWTGMKRA